MNTTPEPRPLPNSYWATPLLLACEYPGARLEHEAAPRLDALLGAGIRDFYDLTEAGELQPYETHLRERAGYLGISPDSVRFRRFPIRDVSIPSPKRLEEVLAALEDSAASGRRAAVHCWGGVGRTGTVVGCHLMRQHGLSGDEALARIAEAWKGVEKSHRIPRSPETDEQAAFVRSFRPVQS
jgi:atypical dual specificity phosphatase